MTHKTEENHTTMSPLESLQAKPAVVESPALGVFPTNLSVCSEVKF